MGVSPPPLVGLTERNTLGERYPRAERKPYIGTPYW